jgi:hypothetical protein
MTKPTAEIEKYFKDVQKSIGSADNMRKLGAFAIRMIVQRTRGEGKGVSRPGGRASKLKRVTDEYADRRRRMEGKHPEAAAGTNSNLTLFGPLLGTMMVKRATKSSLFLGFRNRKEAQKAEGQERQGRRFMVLSGVEMKSASSFLAALVAKQNR